MTGRVHIVEISSFASRTFFLCASLLAATADLRDARSLLTDIAQLLADVDRELLAYRAG